MCEKERSRVALLSEISKFLHEVRHTITVSMKPLANICREFKTDEPYFRSLLDGGLDALRESGGVGGLEARVGKDGAGVLLPFVRGFGRGYLSEEIARCDIAIKEFDAVYAAERAGVSKRLRVCRTLGVASSFALVILFI